MNSSFDNNDVAANHQAEKKSQSLNFEKEKDKIGGEENTFDFLDSYHSDQDEDYSEKEDLIINKKFYAKDIYKPFEKKVPKTEIEYLLKDKGPTTPRSPVAEASIFLG